MDYLIVFYRDKILQQFSPFYLYLYKTEKYVQEAIDYNVEKGFIAENSDGYVEFIG